MLQSIPHPRHWVDASGNPVNPEIAFVGDTALDWLAALSIPSLGVQVYSYEGQYYSITAQDDALVIQVRSGTAPGAILYAEANPTRSGEMVSYQMEIAPEHVDRFRTARQWLSQIESQRQHDHPEGMGEPD
ncbi:MAG: hypothetical protein SFW36_22850 [Leptolyngbyaceae cyanobacterium bins.59]|nr:hypothetical protein [Leptolyngbyaceae cyanobacterium bins.59]